MSKVKIKATIYYMIDTGHPDYRYYKKPEGLHEFSDTYTIDIDKFVSMDDVENYIKHDLALVAGGGYNAAHIHKVRFKLEFVK